MGVTRVGNVALYNTTMRDVTNVQQRLAELQEQVSSGIKAKNFAGLSGQVEQFTLLEAKMRSAQQYIESNQVNVARMRTADTTMGQMVDTADAMENLIVTGRNGATREGLNFEQNMMNFLKQLQGQLNANFEGRYLFGGTNTSTAPVSDITLPPYNSGAPDTRYYQGSEQNLVYRQEERMEYEITARADDPAFQKIIAAAHLAIEGFNSNDDEKMGRALEMIQQGQAELNSVRNNLNNTIVSVETSTAQLESLSLYWKGVTEQVSKTDLVATSTEVANHTAILQASFSVFATLSQLRLSDYLR